MCRVTLAPHLAACSHIHKAFFNNNTYLNLYCTCILNFNENPLARWPRVKSCHSTMLLFTPHNSKYQTFIVLLTNWRKTYTLIAQTHIYTFMYISTTCAPNLTHAHVTKISQKSTVHRCSEPYTLVSPSQGRAQATMFYVHIVHIQVYSQLVK